MTIAGTRHGSAVVTLPVGSRDPHHPRLRRPRRLVFRAWTTPELVRRWWGFESSPLVVCDIDLRAGGAWRYVTREPDGTELGWHGTYLEIDAPQRLVSTEVFEGYPDAEARNTLTLAAARRHDASCRSPSCTPARRTATATSPPAWRAACSTRSTASRTCSPSCRRGAPDATPVE